MTDTARGVGRTLPRPSRRGARAVAEHPRRLSPRPPAVRGVLREARRHSRPGRSTSRPSGRSWRRSRRRPRARTNARTARATVARTLSSVRSFHRFLLREGGTERDPAAAVVQPKLPRSLPHPLPLDDVIAASWRRPTPRPPSACATARSSRCCTGPDCGSPELVGLDVDDVDLEEGSVRVLGKGAKEREVPLGRVRPRGGGGLPHARAADVRVRGQPRRRSS